MKNRIIDDITDFLFISDNPRKADVILLPGGSDPAVPERAAELYADGYALFLIPAGGVSIKTGKFNGVKHKTDIYCSDYPTDCAFYTDVLLKNGVPQSAIIGEDKSGFTKENATFSRKAADEYGLDVHTAIVVCKSFHARRCLICYQFAFPEAEILIVPVDVYDINRDNWYDNGYGVERVLGELARCGNQFVNEFKNTSVLGLHKQAVDFVLDGVKTQDENADEILVHIDTLNHGCYIKKAKEADLSKVIKIDPFLRTDLISCSIKNGGCYVAVQDSVIAGFAFLNYSFFNNGFIELLIVDENYRKRGIGTALLNHLFEKCVTEKLFTSTNQSNEPMKKLLLKSGFILSGQIYSLDEGDPELFFVRKKVAK